jgi:threonine/homoserine/homoserine lactone efflux protein
MAFIPDLNVMLAYTLASFILFITPGPDMSLFLSRTVAGGRRAGIASMAGALSGCAVHTLAAALGLSAIIAASPTAFTMLKIAGALYLAWLAVDALRNGSALNVKDDAQREVDLKKTFLLGAMVNLLNPKVILFFITFLPQFVEAGDPNATGKFLFLGLYFIVFSIPPAIAMIVGAEKVIETLRQKPRVMRAIDWCFAGIFGAFAVRILATQGK